MIATLRSWWQQIKQHRVAIGVVAIVLVVVIALIIVGYGFDWTGFNGYNKVTIVHTISGTNAGTVTRTEEYQPGKGLWDWLQLLGILAIPAVVGLGTVWFTSRQTQASEANRAQQAKESEANREKRHQTDLEIAKENRERQQQTDLQIAEGNQREAALQTYIDKLTDLALKTDLRGSYGAGVSGVREKAELQTIARAQTLMVLPRLDGARKRSVLQFLQAAHLIDRYETIIDLSSADLRRAALVDVDLHEANLREVDLYEADLSEADLAGAIFREAKLWKANLRDANLRKADLTQANFTRANLTGADFTEADLSYANLRGAKLGEANLSGVKLFGADLGGVDLEGVTGIKVEELEKQAKSLQAATMPDGSIHR